MATLQIGTGYNFMNWYNDSTGSESIENRTSTGFKEMFTEQYQTVAVATGTNISYGIEPVHGSSFYTAGTITSYVVTKSGNLLFSLNNSEWDIESSFAAHAAGGTPAVQEYWLRGNDTVLGSTGNEVMLGFAGNDTITGFAGNDNIDGGAGIDTAVYTEARSAITVTASGTAAYNATGTSISGSDTITNIERLKFTDTMLALDITANSGKVYRLYQAAFNRTPDAAGLGFWINAADKGANLVTDAAAGFINSPEFISLYGANPTNGEFVALLYNNVLHRSLDQGGYDFWVNALSSGSTRPEILYSFSESTENQTNVASVIASGIAYQEWIG